MKFNLQSFGVLAFSLSLVSVVSHATTNDGLEVVTGKLKRVLGAKSFPMTIAGKDGLGKDCSVTLSAKGAAGLKVEIRDNTRKDEQPLDESVGWMSWASPTDNPQALIVISGDPKGLSPLKNLSFVDLKDGRIRAMVTVSQFNYIAGTIKQITQVSEVECEIQAKATIRSEDDPMPKDDAVSAEAEPSH